MTPLSRPGLPAVLVAVLAAVAGMAVPARAQDATRVRVRVDARDVVLHGGEAYVRDARSGRYERVSVHRDRNGLPVYYRVVVRPWFDGWYDGWQGWPSAGFDDYRPPARRVDCSSSGNCTVWYYDPRYDRRFDRAGHGDGDRGHRNRDGHGTRRHRDGD